MSTPQPWSIFQQGGGQGAAVTWADELLSRLGDPKTTGAEQVIYDWELSEGGGGWRNPLNLEGGKRAFSTGVVGAPAVSNYATYGGGLADTRDRIRSLIPNLSRDLKSNPDQARSDIIASAWSGSSHYGGGKTFSTAPLPGHKSALKGSPGPGGGSSTLTGKGITCPGFWQSIFLGPSGFADWLACRQISGIKGSSNNFFVKLFEDPVDYLERGGLIVFGAILIIIGLAAIAKGPVENRVREAAGIATAARGVSRGLGFGGSTETGGRTKPEPTAEQIAEKERRMSLAERNTELGSRKIAVAESKERRLQRRDFGKRHSSGREPNPEPIHG
jgi:hypothetical protein